MENGISRKITMHLSYRHQGIQRTWWSVCVGVCVCDYDTDGKLWFTDDAQDCKRATDCKYLAEEKTKIQSLEHFLLISLCEVVKSKTSKQNHCKLGVICIALTCLCLILFHFLAFCICLALHFITQKRQLIMRAADSTEHLACRVDSV